MSAEYKGRVIVIDPGHGGEDGGATGTKGTVESAVNLSISLRLRELLRLFGVEPHMIRETDISVHSSDATTISEKKVSDLHNRVAQINATPGALVVSVHQNFFGESKYKGAQVFYADTVMSRELAERMQEQLRVALAPENHRQAKSASSSIYLMNHINCDGILIECGFLSNEEEEAKLNTAAYQKQLVLTITSVLMQYVRDTNEV